MKAFWKRFLRLLAWFASLAAVLFFLLISIPIVNEWGYRYNSRMARGRADMTAIEIAIGKYVDQHGHFPHEMADLGPPTWQPHNDAYVLPMVPKSPWNTPYRLEIVHGPNGDKLRLWTVPDKETQERTKMHELSNEYFGVPSATDRRELSAPTPDGNASQSP